MNPKTELLLYQMLWGADKVLQPTLRNLEESFEGWVYRNGLQWQVARLEASGYLESGTESLDETRLHRLTEAGRRVALGGRDPESAWGRTWDRRWWLFLFDVPERHRSLRRQLTRSLAAWGCGCLQRSVWISASLPAGMDSRDAEDGSDCSHLLMLEAESRGPVVDRQMVAAAWDFDRINTLYERDEEILSRLPARNGRAKPEDLADWARIENEAWLAAVRADPLLPSVLLPKGYRGRSVWRRRKRVLARAGRLAGKMTTGSDPEGARD